MDELEKKFREHDEEAFEEAVRKYLPLTAAVIRGVSCGKLADEDIEELIADSFVRLWNNADKVEDGCLRGYLCRIARNLTLNRLDFQHRRPAVSLEDIDPEDDFRIEGDTEQKELAEIIGRALDALGEPDREIMLRYYYYEQNTQYIADSLSISREAVKSRLRRARDKVKKYLTERGYEL